MFLTKDYKIQSNKPETNQTDERMKLKEQQTYLIDEIMNTNKQQTYQKEQQTYQIETKNKKKKKRKKTYRYPKLAKFIKFILTMIILILLTIMIVAGYAIYQVFKIAKDAKLSKNDLAIKYENSVVKDMQGNTLGVLNGNENRESISLSEMPEYLPKAFISIEDERFYEHRGVDLKRTAGAVYTYITNKGKSPFGGSTITQQLVKNLTQEKEETWQRKVREMARAYYIEEEMSKEEILELYLNLIFLGDTVYGVQKGANYYFNKDAKDLSLAESAFLAGINKSPNSYNPFDEDNEETLELIKERTKIVLQKMIELGNIDQEQYKQAVKEVDEGLKFEKGAAPQTMFSYHTDAAINQIIYKLQKMNDWTYEQAKLYLFSGGFTIYTTEDPNMTAILEEELSQPKYQRADYDEYGNIQPTQASMVLIDNNTGYVVAIANGFDKKEEAFGFNIATDAKKQTGSSMKPIAVVAPAIDKGIITAATVFDDSPTSFYNGTYEPKDYGNSYRGLITVRQAIETSQNIPMVKAMCLLTPDESVKFLKSAGITSIEDGTDNVLALALGGLTWGVTPLEMAGAYATIANNGKYREPTFFTKVVDSDGNIFLEADTTGKPIMSEGAAYVTKQILTQPVKTGTAQLCAINGMDVAAKTGTTNNDYDRWLCGFTPYYTATVWYGHDTNATVSGWSISPASQIWSGAMQRIHSGLEPKKFDETKPEDVVQVEVCKKSGFLASKYCKRYGTTYTEYFVKGKEPAQTCPYHSYAKICTESGLLANPNCPRTRSVYARGEFIGNSSLWNTKSSYYKSKSIPTQVCTVH